MNPPLLERLTIALVGVLLVSALVGWINYDMQRTAAPQPTTRTGLNSPPIHCAQLRRPSARAVSATPTLAPTDFPTRVPTVRLTRRGGDPAERDRPPAALN